MKRLKKVAWGFLFLLITLAIGVWVFINALKPTYEGEQSLRHLSEEVNVYYDTYGIPHIYANTETDAARALGYVHAQDRLWQMELLRRIAKGGLSQVFGADLLETDKLFLSLGIDDASVETVEQLDMRTEMAQISQAYLDGINAFIDQGPTPIEFYLTGIEKTHFTLKDTYNSIGYMAFSFAMAHKTDPLLTNIKNKLGVAYLKDLEIAIDPNSTLIKNHIPTATDAVQNTITASVTTALEQLNIPMFEGSNSWVLGPEKTKNNHVIFANDPHIGFSQPSVWYEAHINTPSYEKYGYYLAGVPFPMLGHDRNIAYGLTMFENDDVDFYYEHTNPKDSTEYMTAGGWQKYEMVSKAIKVKDAAAVVFTYKKTKHGPIINTTIPEVVEKKPVAMSWIYTKVENQVLDAIYGMTQAKNITTFKAALPKIHAPGINVMYGDAKGNVAWFATAKLYQMPDSVHTKFILDGSTGKEEPIRYLDFLENPQAINPPWHYVYSANNQPDSIGGKLYPGYYLSENRAKRIVELLEPKNNWDKKAVSTMITDVTSAVNPSIITDMSKIIDVAQMTPIEVKVLDILTRWEGDYQLESIAPTIYHAWVFQFLKNTFADELGAEQFQQFMATHFHKRIIAPMTKKEVSVWWDDRTTKDIVETRKTIIQKSFKMAVASLEHSMGTDISLWTWNKVHSLEHKHPIGQVPALQYIFGFNVGPFPIHGGREVINNLGFSHNKSGKYTVGGGPSTRRVIDFSDIENSISILPTGQSGNPFSPHYDDQAQMFVNGEFRKMMMNKKEIIETSKSLLIFTPQK